VYFHLLEEFVAREGHARVRNDHLEGNFALGRWVERTRRAFRRGELTREQVRSLRTLPGWTWSPRDDRFEEGLVALRAFVRREGHALVPHAHREGRVKLGFWVAVRRREHLEGRMSRERVRALESLPGWSWGPAKERFGWNLERLRRFVAREGHARVPDRHREAGLQLGRWVETLRRRRSQGRLSQTLVRRLGRLPGWTWSVREDRFGRGLEALRVFVRREGHARVPAQHVEGGFLLGTWVANRRGDYRRGLLSPERARLLEKSPGWTWRARQASFERGCDHLRRFVSREGHARVPSDHVERAFPLGRWVAKLRQARSRLPAERARRLAALPGWTWNKYDAQFQEGLRRLREFSRREGHALVPARHVESGFRLGAWTARWRRRKAGMPRARRKALESVRGWTWNPRRRSRSHS
jgi:hypothetical protein